MISENEKLVEKFLKEIKKNLPEWIKSNNEKVEDILMEINSHIWDSAQEIAGSDDPDSTSIQTAITRLGSPKDIANSYKKRGTPKYFISEELWSTYTRIILPLTFIIFILIFIVQIILVEPTNLLQAVVNGITLSYPSILTFVLIVSLIFVALSAEGYFPKDLTSQNTTHDETEKKKSDYYKPDEFLFNGLVSILFGLFLIILPVDMLNIVRIIVIWILQFLYLSTTAFSSGYVSISMELRILLTLYGILGVIAGLINLLKMRTKDREFQIRMNWLSLLLKIVDFALSFYIVVNLHLISEVLPLSDTILFLLCALGIFGTITEIITIIAKNIKHYSYLEEKKESSA